jgi:hypothetical protein
MEWLHMSSPGGEGTLLLLRREEGEVSGRWRKMRLGVGRRRADR